MSYENPWHFEGKPFLSENINDNFGFVYLITNLTNGRSTLAENTFGHLENHQERKEKLNKRVIGSGITDLVQN